MRLTRTVAIGVLGGGLVAWLSWATTPAPRPLSVPRPRPRAVDQSSAELAREIARLRERLAPEVAPQGARNMFAFLPRSSARQLAPESVTPKAADGRTIPRAPALTLEGMAEEIGADGLVRTAIISAGGELFLARIGDNVTSRYRVEQLSADGAELADLETGAGVRLVLR